MDEDRRRWEARYAAGLRKAADPPSDFLVAHAALFSGRVLDVAAGVGRNALFLAHRGCVVEALDISFTALRIARASAAAQGLDLLAAQVDLESFPLRRGRYDGILNIRYLQRSLFAPMQRAVRPGGIILFDTFLLDQQALGHPSNPAFLLRRGELREAFSGFEILVYEEGLFETQARPAYLARMIARRPAAKVD